MSFTPRPTGGIRPSLGAPTLWDDTCRRASSDRIRRRQGMKHRDRDWLQARTKVHANTNEGLVVRVFRHQAMGRP